MYTYEAKIARVVDGDTIDLEIDLGFHCFTKQRCRLFGVDTPEIHTTNDLEKKYGYKAMERVEALHPVGSICKITSEEYGKFGRPLVKMWSVPGVSLHDLLIEERLAVAYKGQNKADIEKAHAENWAWHEEQAYDERSES